MALNRFASSDCGPYRCPCRDPSNCPMYRNSCSACASIPPASIWNGIYSKPYQLVFYRLYQRFTSPHTNALPNAFCAVKNCSYPKRNAIKINGISGKFIQGVLVGGFGGLWVSGERNACTQCSYRIFSYMDESLIWLRRWIVANQGWI